MNAVQVFFLGMMAGWTPSIILLAWMLWRDGIAQDEVGDVTTYRRPKLPLEIPK